MYVGYCVGEKLVDGCVEMVGGCVGYSSHVGDCVDGCGGRVGYDVVGERVGGAGILTVVRGISK